MTNPLPELATLAHATPAVGTPVADIDTPSLVVDLDAMERNLQRMAQFAQAHGIRWRPHAKMHKSAQMALRQIAAGAVGVCVQKTAEAIALAQGGVRDIYISNQVVAPHKLARVAALAVALARTGGRLAIAVDSEAGIEGLARAMAAAQAAHGTIDVFVEIDVGHGRCGAPATSAGTLAQAITRHPSMRFAGLQAYHGRAQHLRTAAERAQAIAHAAQCVRLACQQISDAGLAVPLVTGAGTGTMVHEASSGLWGELQVGSFLFMDADYRRNAHDPAQPAFEPALFVRSAVTGRYAAHAVCDAGHKSHAIDSGMPEVHGPAGLQYTSGGDEHGVLRLDADRPGGSLPDIGTTVWLIPGHCDPTVNLHDAMVGVRGGLQHGVVECIIAVDARGALT